MDNRRMNIKNIFLFILILLIGICLRIYNLDKYDFWNDEAADILITKEFDSFDVTDYGYFMNPPLFYWLLGFWLHLGNSEFILRLLPFIFGILSIPAIYFVGKELFNKKAGLISAFILTISPFHIYYSQGLRAYSLVTFLALMMIYYLVKSLKENKLSYWVGFIVFTTLTLYSHNTAVFLIIVVNCFFILFYKRYKVLLRKWLISQFFILLFYIPWVKIIFEQLVHLKVSNYFQWISPDQLFNFITTFLIFNLGYNAKEVTYSLAILLFLPLLLLGVWNSIKKEQIYLLLFWLFVPMIIVMIFSALIFPIYLVRSLIYVSPAYYIIIAYGLSKLRANKIYLYFLVFFSILVGFSLKSYYQNLFYLQNLFSTPVFSIYLGEHPKKEIRLAIDYITQYYKKGDIVIHTCEATYMPFLFYLNNSLEENFIVYFYENKSHNLTTSYPIYSKILKKLKFVSIDLKEIKEGSYKRIWLVFSGWENNQITSFSKVIKEHLDESYVMIDCENFAGLEIYLYQIE